MPPAYSFILFMTIIALLLLCLCSAQAIVHEKAMGAWSLHIDSCPKGELTGFTMMTSMPTSLHLDLMRAEKIPDTFKGSNWEGQKWISQCNITYSKKLALSKQLLASEVIELVLEGVDTYATVSFNGHQLLSTANAFVEYRALIQKDWILSGADNEIKIQLYGTGPFDSKADRLNKMPFIYAQTRKACYQYSWDWAPFMNTIGVWKDIYLVGYNKIMIEYVWARNKQIHSDYAIINFAVSLKNRNKASVSGMRLEVSELHNLTATVKSTLSDSEHQYLDVRIDNPKLWWPNGLGDPFVYEFKVSLIDKNDQVDEKKVVFGVRSVELDLANKKFTVKVNGYPVYCKGANYVPPDMLYPRLTNPDYTPGNTIDNLLQDAVDSHFNMIRLWGGGQYESNQLLEKASRLGIMIFYDFMFSDSIYPSTPDFLKNVEVQIRQQVQRARNYPCLVLWSGNNEIFQGIKSWGWSRGNYVADYRILFEETIPKILARQDPQTPYIPTSPLYGVGNGGFDRGGDVHYWGVWAGGSDFQNYKSAIGPFNSQFGTQAIPVWETVKNFTEPSERTYESKAFLSHERHNSKFSTLRKYIKRYAHQSKDMEMESYLSGLIQAFGVEIAIISQRISKPHSWGTLYWQFNDAWPGISWSSIDYYGRWKPLQFMAKRLYPNTAVFCQDGRVTVVNDNLHEVEVLVMIRVQDMRGKIMLNTTEVVKLKENEVKRLKDLKDFHSDSVVVYTEIVAGRNQEMWSTAFFVPFKDLKLDSSAKLFVKYFPEYNLIEVRTDKFIKNLYISSSEEYLKLSDNYFDMVAEKVYKIKMLPAQSGKTAPQVSALRGKLVFRSYVQIHSEERLEVVEE